MIPKIIHQVWVGGELPEKYKRWSQTFQSLLPDWQYRLWGNEDCLELVRRSFPNHLETYVNLKVPAQKADVIRYMALCTFGGLYADIDCECKRPLDFIAADDEFIVSLELKTSSRKVMELYPSDLAEVYCQWAFLSRPQHPVLTSLIDELPRASHTKFSDNPMLDFVKRTGPHLFTGVLKDYLSRGGTAKIVPSSFFGCCDGRNTVRFALSFLFPELFRKVYVRHHFEGTWIDKQVRREMFMRNVFLFNLLSKRKKSG
ncbi:MAG: glycosyltransferase family 32 protein [Limisphaerales bacterium]